jgi:hypothetical protein
MSIEMTTKPHVDMNKDEQSHISNAPLTEPRRKIYPEVNARFTGVLAWLGLAFVVMVFLVQHFSGYS